MTDSCPVQPVTRRGAVVLFSLTGLAGLLFLACDGIPDTEQIDGLSGVSGFRYGQPLLGWLIDALRADCVDSWSVRLFGALLSSASERLTASSTWVRG